MALGTVLFIGESKKNFSVLNENSPTFSLNNFEGPLELLLYLIQKDEIDICSIAIKELTNQFIQSFESLPEVETSSETLSLAATLLLIKSQRLLPDENVEEEELNDSPRLELIQSLLEYCRLKDAAKELSIREHEQKAHFPRATPPYQKELGPGLEEVGLDHLKNLLLDLLKKSESRPKKTIQEEEWQVAHKLTEIRALLKNQERIEFFYLFSEHKSRKELIVLFLALLEMMKHQEAKVVKESEILYICSAL